MPSGQHIVMGRFAFNALAQWQQEFWHDQREDITNYCLVPDMYFVEKEKYAKYCVMDNGQVIPHGPTDDDWTGLPFVKRHTAGPQRYTIAYYLAKLVESIAAGQRTDSALFAGVFGHFLQDSSQPAHLVHNDWLYQLVARPQGRYLHLHRELDSADPDETVLEKIRPCLLGSTVAEAAFYLQAHYERMIQESLASLVPLIHAAYAGDKAAATKAITKPYATATFLTASAWYTAHCIAAGRFSDDEKQTLSQVDLSSLTYTEAFSMDPYGFHPLLDAATDTQGNAIALSMNIKNEQGHVQENTIDKGIAMSWGNVAYDIPSSMYKKLQVTLGLLSSVPDDAKAVFKVVLDGGPVVYAAGEKTIEDHGGDIVFDSGVITGADSAISTAIPLGKATRITLIVECPGKNTSAIWAMPLLVK